MMSGDLVPGFRIGSLTCVVKTQRALSSGRRMPAWSLRCDCGVDVVAMTVNLIKGKHRSCGCKRGDLMCEAKGFSRDTHRPEYRVYRQMLDRCHLETASNFKWYGGKGVTVCERWRRGTNELTGFQAFLADMGERPTGMTIERDDPRLPYEPHNCRWATWVEQANNKREHRLTGDERFALRLRRAKGRLSEATIRRVRELLHDRVPQVEIAAATGVSQSHVSRIKNGQILAWKGRAY